MANPTLRDAHEAFYRALGDIFRGDVTPMHDLWSHADDVTYMSPLGDLLVGWAPIRDAWADQAATITGGPVNPEEVRLVESDGLGVVVGFERGSIVIGGETQAVNIRATSTYRCEDGDWKMIGHHTDRL
ncbi:MAG: YybH family protein [Actinomycetota bacterium]